MQPSWRINDENLHEQIAAVSRSLEHQVNAPPPTFGDDSSPSLHHHGSKKRLDPEENSSKTHEGESDESNTPKKMKRDASSSSVGYSFANATAEDMASLEALAQGSVPDMSTVASSIASLSAQPSPPGWAFMVPSGLASPQGAGSSMAQQQLYHQLLMHQQVGRAVGPGPSVTPFEAWYLQSMQREMQTQLRDDGGSSSGSLAPPTNVFTSAEGTGMFMLLEQPNEVQRKSYKNENRCLLPNPLTICQKEFVPEDKRGQIPMDATVTVTLVDQDGEDLAPNKAHMLDSIERSMTQALDENLTAQFSLKIMETSEGNMVRLLFTVRYRLKNLGSCEEKILSRPFVVYSNRKKNIKATAEKEKPVVVDIKPSRGDYNKETEVWIKGKGFCDKVTVQFGDHTAKVSDTSENLITVIAPPFPNILHDTTVEVQVSNKFARELYSSDKKLSFTYLTSSTEMPRSISSVTAALLPQPSLEGNMMVPMLDDKNEHLGHHHQ